MTTGVGHFGAKYGDEGVDGDLCIANHVLTRSGRDMGLSYAKEILRYLLPFEQNARTNVTNRQRDRPRNGNLDRSRQKRLTAMSPNKYGSLIHQIVVGNEYLMFQLMRI